MPIQPMPIQMSTNRLNVAKGWPHEAALDFKAKISANVLYSMVAGQVGHLNASGQLEPGVVGQQMGLFLFSGSTDPDVNNAAPSNLQWVPISPTGQLTLLPAKGPYEMETTEFDSTQSYSPLSTLVRAPTGNGAGAYPGSGQLTSASLTFGTNAYCGVVSRGVFTNSYGQKALAFWPEFGPVSANS